MKTKKFTGDRIFDFVNVTVILLITIIILVPLLNVLASSFSGSTALAEGGFIFFPKEWSLDNYRAVFKDTSIWKAFFISVAKTVIGVVTHVFFCAMVAFALSKKDLRGRKLYTVMGIITMFFSGGMIPTYLLMKQLGLLNNFMVYILPQLFSYYDKEEKLVFFQKKIETEGHSPRGMHGYLDSLKEKIRSFDREKTEQELHGIFGLIRQESYISINVLRRNFMDILGIYSLVAQSLDGALEEIELDGDNCHYQKIMMMESLREIEKWFLKFNDIFMEKFWIAYKCSRSEILQKVVKYIEAHITEPIHLSDAAAETGVSSAYLSTMFKKEIGYNFIEYVNLRKIELARQMLQDGKMVYEVSELLGFENSTYFSRVFKRYTDVSPDTYRKQM